MKDTYILGIESSCDETSVSIVKNGNEEIATTVLSQIDIHKKFGGVVPEIASRSHVESVTMVIDDCLKKANMSLDEIDAIAVTKGPGLAGSLLVGVEAAKSLALAFKDNKNLGDDIIHAQCFFHYSQIVKRNLSKTDFFKKKTEFYIY